MKKEVLIFCHEINGMYKSRDAKFDIVCCSIMADDEFKVCALELSDFVHNVLHIAMMNNVKINKTIRDIMPIIKSICLEPFIISHPF